MVNSSYDVSLWTACSRGVDSEVSEILKKDVEIEERGGVHGSTPLLAAVENGNLSVVEMLIEAKADCSARDGRGMCPLHIAVCGGFLDIAEKLLMNGCDVNARIE